MNELNQLRKPLENISESIDKNTSAIQEKTIKIPYSEYQELIKTRDNYDSLLREKDSCYYEKASYHSWDRFREEIQIRSDSDVIKEMGHDLRDWQKKQEKLKDMIRLHNEKLNVVRRKYSDGLFGFVSSKILKEIDKLTRDIDNYFR